MKKMKLLTKEQQESYKNAKIYFICKKYLKTDIWKIKNIIKLENIVIMQENGSNYDYHFIVRVSRKKILKKHLLV